MGTTLLISCDTYVYDGVNQKFTAKERDAETGCHQTSLRFRLCLGIVLQRHPDFPACRFPAGRDRIPSLNPSASPSGLLRHAYY